jgi:putative tryptophan/tyrosine transport system substrate-binding protein
MLGIGRREFITLLGGAAAAWPLTARAQQSGAMPVVGFLSQGSAESDTEHSQAFRKGLNEAGFTDGRNVAIEYRWANFQEDRLPGLVGDLVRRQAAVIAATGNLGTVLAVKQAAATTPIVFNSGIDPVKAGLVAALNKPGGNITGITSLNTQVGSKQIGLMHELLPNATRLALLVHREDPANVMDMITGAQEAAAALGLQIDIVYASNGSDIETALADVVQKRASGLIITPGNLFIQRRVQIATLAVRDGMPAIYVNRIFPEAGGLMSYGSDWTDTFRQAGVYCGRILKGEKPADLPVLQQTKFHLVINLSTAKALRLQIPPTLLALADEVIE